MTHVSLEHLVDRADDPEVRAHLERCPACRARARVVADLDDVEGLPGLAEARARMDEARRTGARDLSRSLSGAGDLDPGRHLDRYVVEDRVGHGGMGTVYRVRHAELGSMHALKVMHAGFSPLADRLMREGRAQGRLRHPNVVRVTDVVEVDGAPALVMELVEGPSLAQWLAASGPPALPELDRLAAGIVRGVAAAHRAGLVHRDLKPANVLLAPTEEGFVPKVGDFGLARVVEDPSGPDLARPHSPLGTPSYMAPEQIRDASTADARSDVFALGAVLYELATGRRAFGGLDVAEVYERIRAGRYDPPPASLPARIRSTLVRALDVDPERRFQSAEALLASWRGEHAVAWPRWPWLVAAAVVAIAAAVGLWPTPEPPAAEVREKRLTALPDTYQIYTFAVSPDGETLAWGDSRGLWLQPLDGGAANLILADGTVQNVDWYPDGERLMISSEGVGTRVVSREGAVTPLLDASGRFVRLSPDGTHLAWTDTTGLWVADLATGQRRRLRPLSGGDDTVALAWSTSGRALAAVHQARGGSSAWLEITAADGSTSRRILEDRRLVSLGLAPLVWLPGDRLVYGLTERQHQPDRATTLYVLPSAEAATDAGAASAVHRLPNVGVTQARAVPDGQLVLAKIAARKVVYRLPLDAPEARTPLGTDDWEKLPLGWWSDSEVLVASDREGGGVFLWDVAGDGVTRVAAGPVTVAHADRVGDALLWWTWDPERDALVARRTDLRGGTTRDLLAHRGERIQLRCTRRCVLGEQISGRLVFRALDPDSGERGETLLELPATPYGSWDLHPDGTRIALVATRAGAVAIQDLGAGTETRLRLRIEDPFSVAWAADGQRLYVSGLTESASEPYQLVEVGLDGSERPLWSSRSWLLHAPAPSPDGRELAVGAYAFDDDLWAIDGLF